LANDKKFVVKNGLSAQNISFKSDINAADSSTITVEMLNGEGVLSYEGTSGQLFSITDSLSGTIFSVNDISGIPSIEVDDDGTIRLGEFGGNILVGTNVDDGVNKLQVNGSISATFSYDNSNSGLSATDVQAAIDETRIRFDKQFLLMGA
jgi:hypothetical protein